MNLLLLVFTSKWLIACVCSLNINVLQLLLGSCKGHQAGTSFWAAPSGQEDHFDRWHNPSFNNLLWKIMLCICQCNVFSSPITLVAVPTNNGWEKVKRDFSQVFASLTSLQTPDYVSFPWNSQRARNADQRKHNTRFFCSRGASWWDMS